jgi:hypothetical protein
MSLSIRLSTHSDSSALAVLAAIDGTARLSGRALIAERDGVAIAAVALTSGRVVADPSHRLGEAVHMLRLRRYRLLRQGGQVARIATLRARPVTARAAA